MKIIYRIPVLILLLITACGKNPASRKRSAPEPPVAVASDDAEAKPKDPNSTRRPPADPTTDIADLDGPGLYAKLCESCHGEIDHTEVPKIGLEQLRNAIATVSTMSFLKEIGDRELLLVIDALSKIPPGKAKGKGLAKALTKDDKDQDSEIESE